MRNVLDGMRQGALDPAFGQHAAFPLESDGPGIDYVRSVREEAIEIAREFLKSHHTPAHETNYLEYSEPAPKRYRSSTQSLSELNKEIFELESDYAESLDSLESVLEAARKVAITLAPQRPDNCDSRAKWKAYVWENPPIPLNHDDAFRLLRYLPKWVSGSGAGISQLKAWMWSIAARCPDVLDGDDMAVLRDAIRALSQFDVAKEVCDAIAIKWDQLDLVSE